MRPFDRHLLADVPLPKTPVRPAGEDPENPFWEVAPPVSVTAQVVDIHHLRNRLATTAAEEKFRNLLEQQTGLRGALKKTWLLLLKDAYLEKFAAEAATAAETDRSGQTRSLQLAELVTECFRQDLFGLERGTRLADTRRPAVVLQRDAAGTIRDAAGRLVSVDTDARVRVFGRRIMPVLLEADAAGGQNTLVEEVNKLFIEHAERTTVGEEDRVVFENCVQTRLLPLLRQRRARFSAQEKHPDEEPRVLTGDLYALAEQFRGQIRAEKEKISAQFGEQATAAALEKYLQTTLQISLQLNKQQADLRTRLSPAAQGSLQEFWHELRRGWAGSVVSKTARILERLWHLAADPLVTGTAVAYVTEAITSTAGWGEGVVQNAIRVAAPLMAGLSAWFVRSQQKHQEHLATELAVVRTRRLLNFSTTDEFGKQLERFVGVLPGENLSKEMERLQQLFGQGSSASSSDVLPAARLVAVIELETLLGDKRVNSELFTAMNVRLPSGQMVNEGRQLGARAVTLNILRGQAENLRQLVSNWLGQRSSEPTDSFDLLVSQEQAAWAGVLAEQQADWKEFATSLQQRYKWALLGGLTFGLVRQRVGQREAPGFATATNASASDLVRPAAPLAPDISSPPVQFAHLPRLENRPPSERPPGVRSLLVHNDESFASLLEELRPFQEFVSEARALGAAQRRLVILDPWVFEKWEYETAKTAPRSHAGKGSGKTTWGTAKQKDRLDFFSRLLASGANKFIPCILVFNTGRLRQLDNELKRKTWARIQEKLKKIKDGAMPGTVDFQEEYDALHDATKEVVKKKKEEQTVKKQSAPPATPPPPPEIRAHFTERDDDLLREIFAAEEDAYNRRR